MNIFTLPTPAHISYLEAKAMDATRFMQEELKRIGLDPMHWTTLTQEERDAVVAHCKREARVAGHDV